MGAEEGQRGHVTGWEQPRSSRARRIVIAAAALVGTLVLVQIAGPSETAADLRITRVANPSGPAERTTASSWPRPRPGSWRPLPSSPLTPRVGAAVVWAGDEMVVWGGYDSFSRPQLSGASFDPEEGVWRPLPSSPSRDASVSGVRSRSHAVFVSSQTWRYDPAQRRWRVGPSVPVPDGHGVGRHVVTFGDTVVAVTEPRDSNQPSAVFALAADADEWRRLPDVPVTLSRGHVVVAVASQLVALGPPRAGEDAAVALDLASTPGTWYSIDAPSGLPDELVSLAGAAAPDGLMMLWGTRAGDRPGRPAYAAVRIRGTWRQIDAGPVRPTRTEVVLWTGDHMLVWSRIGNVGALFDPSTDRWTTIAQPPVVGLDLAREAVWTGTEVLVWGSLGTGGAMYTPR